IVALGFACWTPAGAQSQRDKISLGYGYNLWSLIPTIAAEEGFFAKYGLDVTLVPQPRAQQAMEALVGGSTDFSTTLANRLLFAGVQELPVVAVALSGYGYQAQVVVPASDTTTRD